MTENPIMLKCDDCGKKKKDVIETICPYVDELHDEKVECQLCEDCYHERCMDI